MAAFNLSAWAVRHQALVVFMIVMIGAAGSLAYVKLGRAEDPSFTIKLGVVTAVWPGSTAKEMQDQVADPIEKELQHLPFIDKVTTYSKPAFTALQVAFKDSTPPAEVPYLFYLLRKKLIDVRASLPADLIGPNVNDEYGDVDSLLYTLTGDAADYAQLKRVAESIRQKLLKLPDVAKVRIYGEQDEAIYIDLSQERLANLGIAPQQLFDSLAKQNALNAAGIVESSAQRITLRLSGALSGVDAVAKTPVETAGRVVRLGDIAEVSRGFVDPPSFLVRQEGHPALAIGVVMAKGGNLLSLGGAVKNAMAEINGGIPQGFDIAQIADQPKVVHEAVGEFTRSFVEALSIVLIVSFISLGWRAGIVVALTVPLVLAMVFVVMYAMGLDLHRITLGALIIALGLLVDDAIIATEMMVVKMEQGLDRRKAAAVAWDTTAFPMLTGTLVTAAGFLPVGFAASSTGEYTGGIFWVVMVALLASWLVAVLFTPFIGVKLLAEPKPHADAAPAHEGRLYRVLRAVIAFCVRRRGLVLLATGTLVVLSILSFARVQQQFFPLSERPELFVQLRLPEGTAIGATLASARSAEALLAGNPDIATYTTYVGQGSPRFWLGLNPQLPNEAYAEIVVVAKDIPARERVKAGLEQALASGALAAARVRVDRFNFGPPVGFPLQFRIIGPDSQGVRQIAYQVRDIVRQDPDAIDPNIDWNEQTPSVRLVVDQDRARALGLNPQDIATTLQTLISGYTVTTLRDGTEKVPVIARAVQNERADVSRIGDLTILTHNGAPVPLAQLVKPEYGHEEPILWRRNRDLAITVRSDVRDGSQAPDVTQRIWPRLAEIRTNLKPGYRIEIGGAVEESDKANASLFAIFPVMLAVMLSVLMVQLQSFARLFLVFLTAPLGIVGAVPALLLAGLPFGFVALLGLIALAGMIMRNSVILVDQIDRDFATGQHSLAEAIVAATLRRARPVVLTAFAAILAMIPLSRSAFWGPMAVTIMGGLLFATFLTLLVLPALYAWWFGVGKTRRPALTNRPIAEAQAIALPAE
jgi:multidrug efflux pump